MSIKSLIQFFIILLIIVIISAVYFKYFETNKSVVEEISLSEKKMDEQLENLEKKIIDLERKNNELSKKIFDKQNQSIEKVKPIIEDKDKIINTKKNEIKKDKAEKEISEINDNKKVTEKKEIKNFVKNVEYTSVDQKGNKFYLLAKSGKSNINNNDILDLKEVRGEIKSDKRDTIYIVSDNAQYNAISLNSKFYGNVKINYQDKEITCVNFDINMETNKAIAYNKVVITDPKSVMKAGIIEFDLKTKNVNINPENSSSEIEVISE